MEYMGMREYARLRAVSYEAVRSQVKRYDKELKEHITKEGKKTMLDEWAVNFLDRHRMSRPVIQRASSEESEQEIKQLRAEKDRLAAELDKAKNMIITIEEETKKLREEYMDLMLESAKAELRLEIADKEHEELDKARQELTNITQEHIKANQELIEVSKELARQRDELAKTENELSQYKPTWFGLYKKVKS